jgi:hypothetical protein
MSLPARAASTKVENFGYESIFDDWQELPLTTATVHGQGQLPPIDPSSRRLYAAVARELGEPEAPFIDETWSGNGFNELVDDIARDYPDIYVSASRANPDVTASRYDLVFTGLPSAALVERISQLPVDVDVRYGAPFSHAQLVSLREALSAFAGLDMFVSTDFSPLGTNIRVRYLARGGTLAAQKDAREGIEQEAARVLNGLVGDGPRPVVKFELDNELGKDRDFQDLMAGFGYSGCTSGFAASIGGTQGLLTAKHCTDRPYYAGTGIQMGPVVNASPGIDIQFNSVPSPHSVVRRFKIDAAGTTKSVTGVADPVYGDFVEKYGVTTGYSWGYVTDADTCNSSSGNCHLFKVNMNGDQGDSGGPCVSGQAARGLVQGGVPGSYTYCTKISYSPATVLQW